MSQNEILAARLAAARKDNNYTQEEIAVFLNCGRATITNYESGRRSPDYETLAKLAIKFNVTTDYLLGITGAETTDKDIRYICDFTGLSEKSVDELHTAKELSLKGYVGDTLNFKQSEDTNSKEITVLQTLSEFQLLRVKDHSKVYLDILNKLICESDYNFDETIDSIGEYLNYKRGEIYNKEHYKQNARLYKKLENKCSYLRFKIATGIQNATESILKKEVERLGNSTKEE